MSRSLEDSYRHCARVTRRCAQSFYWGLRLLPREKRRALYAIYAFLRGCDDSADEAAPDERPGQLHRWRRALDAALHGDCAGDPCLPAFSDAVARYAIPGRYFHLLLDGAEMDLSVRRYPTFEALYDYCYRVASTVGLICLHVWGYEGEGAELAAEECGIAFQLTNILRDIREDAARGRIYLPEEDLRRFNYGEREIAGQVRDARFAALMAFQVERARRYYRSVDRLLPCVSPDSRACLMAMAGVYEGLLDCMERSGFDVYSRRIALPKSHKIAIALRAWWRYRNGGETRPSQA